MEPTRGDFDWSEVEGLDALKEKIIEINEAADAEERAELVSELFMNGHEGSTGYINTDGNHKVSKAIGIFNMNSATDCPNADSTDKKDEDGDEDEEDEEGESDVGACQVPWEACYAHISEDQYEAPLHKRRRQQLLWDHLDAKTFADGLLRMAERMRKDLVALRLSESGDFRHNGDIYKAEEIARLTRDEMYVYTYSASHKLSGWEMVKHFTVNQSNSLADYGDRRYMAVPEEEDIPEDGILCPHEKSGGEIKCGDCMACITPDMGDIYITLTT